VTDPASQAASFVANSSVPRIALALAVAGDLGTLRGDDVAAHAPARLGVVGVR
jgi:hypothetical protein